jgi:hypothetical protein
MNRRRVGVVVGLLLAGLVVGLGVAAVGRVREAAAASRCRNNLKQIGIGIQAYADCWNGKLPPLTDQGEGAPTGTGLPSVFATLMPYTEAMIAGYRPGDTPPSEYHAHSSIVFTYRNKDGTPFPKDGGVINFTWPTLIDPSDATATDLRDIPMTLPDGSVGYYATGSYAANGLLPWGRRDPAVKSLADLANTVLLAERPQVCREADGTAVYNLWGLGFYSPHMPAFAALTPDDPPGLASTGQAAPIVPLPAEDLADRDARIQVRVGRTCAAPGPADFGSPIQFIRRDQPCDPRRPGTPHPAGMQVLMGDAGVRVFGPDTTPWVFWAACVPPAPAGR